MANEQKIFEVSKGALLLPPLPIDAPIFKGLSSALIRWDMLESDISSRANFSGFALIESPLLTARAYFLDSKFVAAFAFGDGKQAKPLTRETLISSYSTRDTNISLYTLDRYIVAMLSNASTWILELERTVPQASFNALFSQLGAQRHTGQLVVLDFDWRGVITMMEGQPILSSYESGSVTFYQHEALTRIAIEAEDAGVQLAVYGKGEFALLDQNAILNEGSFEEVVQTWAEILAFCEARTDAARGKMTFDTQWRAASLSLVERYPELDPFLDEVKFSNSSLTMRRPSPSAFEALIAAYLETLKRLGVNPGALYPLLMQIRDKHLKIWRAAGLEVICPF